MSEFIIENGILKKYVGESEHVVIPEDVTKIGERAFESCSTIKSVDISGNVEEIGEYSFVSCRSLLEVKLREGITRIEEDAFAHCVNLTDVQFPTSLQYISHGAFFCCDNLRKIAFKGEVREIGWSVFNFCANITDIIFPENISEFRDGFLERFWDLVSDMFKETNEDIRCPLMSALLKQYHNLATSEDYLSKKLKANRKKLMKYAIKQNDAELVDKLFGLYKLIKLDDLEDYINQSANATAVKAYLLDYIDQNYSKVKLNQYQNDKLDKELGFKEKTLAEWKKIFGIENREDGIAIKWYKGEELEVTIPEKMGKKTVVSIMDDAFSTNPTRLPDNYKVRKNLATVRIPDSVTDIGRWAFDGCKEMTIIAPKGSYAETYANDNNIKFMLE